MTAFGTTRAPLMAGAVVVACVLLVPLRAAAQVPADTAASSQKPLAVLERHRAGVTSVKFSPDARLLATADLKGRIIVWRTGDWSELRTMQHGAEVYAIAFSPDGKTLVSSGGDSTVSLWEAATGKRVRRLRYQRRSLAVAFASGGELLVGTEDGTVHFVDPSTGVERRKLDTNGSVWAVAVSSTSRTLATGLPLRIWDYSTLTARAKPSALAQLGLAFSGDGTLLASAESTGGALLWKVADSISYVPLRLTTQKRANGPRGPETFSVNMPAASIDISRDGRRVVAGSTTSEIYVWNVAPADTLAPTPTKLRGHTMTVSAIALSPDGGLIASGSLDRSVRVWRQP